MEGSPVLCAKLLLGKGGTEPQNAAFNVLNNAIPYGFILLQMSVDVLMLVPEW